MSWIPVEERLPKVGAGHLPVTYHGGRTGVARYNTATKEWYDATGATRHVTAWQPLPEPYKKLRRFVVGMVDGSISLRPYHVTDTEIDMAVAEGIPTREAAETIAKVYEEAYR